MFPQALRVFHDLRAPGAIGLGDRFENAQKPGPVVSVFGGEVCTSKNRLAVRQKKDRKRPAAATRHYLDRAHIDLVEVRTLLAIDLHVHVQLVHDRGGRLVLERLVGHHVTPVAGRVADAEQDQLVFCRRALKRLRTPGIPVHRIVGVLQQIRTSFVDQPVGHMASALR